jgi:membrane protease YdiL (CAAX protease family)
MLIQTPSRSHNPCAEALVAAVAMIALRGEKLTPADIGFGRMSWLSIPFAIALALFFILFFGPIASWVLARSGLGSFDPGRHSLATLPTWYLCLTVVVVAAGEEWLYRGYAIERLEVLTGKAWPAGGVSLLAFTLVHLPLWGIGASLTTFVSGGILTALYIWRRDISFLMLAHVVTDLYGLVISNG